MMIGADVAELRALAADLDTKAGTLRTIGSQLTWRIHSAPWHGADVSRFQHDWNSNHRRAITSTAATITEAARVLRANADQQELASAANFTGQVPSVGQPRASTGGTVDAVGRPAWVAAALGAITLAKGIEGGVTTAVLKFIEAGFRRDFLKAWDWSKGGPLTMLKEMNKATKQMQYLDGGLYKTINFGVGRVLFPVGTVLSAVGFVDSVRAGDVGSAVFSGGSVVLGALSTAVVFGAFTPAAPVILTAAAVWGAASLAYEHRETLIKAGSWVADKVSESAQTVADGARRAVERATTVARGVSDAAAGVIGRITNPLRSVFG